MTAIEPTPPPPTPPPPGLIETDWRKLHALGLPGGSVRALLAVMIFAGIWVWLCVRPQQEVPPYLEDLMFIILGHYFASRAAADTGPEPGPPPLYLPRGTIRLVLVGGFCVVGIALARRHQVWVADPAGGVRLNPGAVALILVAGFLIGVLLSRVRQWWVTRGRRFPRIVEDVRAIISLAAAVALLLIVFGLWSPPAHGPLLRVQHFFSKYHAEDVLAAVVGFYFGSRS